MPKIVRLRFVICRVMNEFLRRCGIRNMILLLLTSLILSYLFSYDKFFDVMDFLISASVDLPPAMQSYTRIEEDLGELGKKLMK